MRKIEIVSYIKFCDTPNCNKRQNKHLSRQTSLILMPTVMKIMLMEKIKMIMKGIKKPELEVARFVAEDVKVNFVEVGVGRAFLVQTPSGGSGDGGGGS